VIWAFRTGSILGKLLIHAALQRRAVAFRLRTGNRLNGNRLNLKHSAFKVLVEDNSGRILGAHLLGAQAEETINLFALAIRAGIKANDLREMIYAYPTHASDVAYMLG